MSETNSAVLAALGSIIGYVGAEVAGPLFFERLLWPSRFYNDLTPWVALKLALFMPMGGPLHRAALNTLDKFQENGLYEGHLKGDMLGSAFFPDTKQTYFPQSGPSTDTKYDARNILWILCLRGAANPNTPIQSKSRPRQSRRTTCIFYHLKLDRSLDPASPQSSDVVVVQEDRYTIRTVAGIFISETTAIMIAIVVGVVLKHRWLPSLLCVPVLLKLLAFIVQVRRQSIVTTMSDDLVRKFGDPDSTILFKVGSRNGAVILIESPPRQFLPFVLHYGHPVRDGKPRADSTTTKTSPDRLHEVLSILIVYAFVLIFPAGLFSLIWLPYKLQCIWLGYQMYLTFAMHISRLAGLDGAGRTEERISRYFRSGKTVILRSQNRAAVQARLTVTAHASVRDGRAALDHLVHARKGI